MDQIKPEFLKKLTKLIVVSIWVLSVLVTHKFDICKFTVQLVTQALGKNYMFLLCNGLLVFVAKCSGLITSSKPRDENWSITTTDKTFDYRDFESYNTILELEYNNFYDHERGESEFFLADEVIVKEDTKQQQTEEKDEEYCGESLNEEEEEEKDEEYCDESLNEEEEEEKVEVMRSSTEEDMNKKFDEFIRKMKEELRIEAKQQLIVV